MLEISSECSESKEERRSQALLIHLSSASRSCRRDCQRTRNVRPSEEGSEGSGCEGDGRCLRASVFSVCIDGIALAPVVPGVGAVSGRANGAYEKASSSAFTFQMFGNRGTALAVLDELCARVSAERADAYRTRILVSIEL